MACCGSRGTTSSRICNRWGRVDPTSKPLNLLHTRNKMDEEMHATSITDFVQDNGIVKVGRDEN